MDDMLKLALGEHAVRVPAWYYIRDHGEGVFSFAGASRVLDNPLALGTTRDVRFCNGELIVRPALVVGTDAYQGYTIGQLVTNHHDTEAMIADGKGEVVRDIYGATGTPRL
jgi:hypothetical protein